MYLFSSFFSKESFFQEGHSRILRILTKKRGEIENFKNILDLCRYRIKYKELNYSVSVSLKDKYIIKIPPPLTTPTSSPLYIFIFAPVI